MIEAGLLFIALCSFVLCVFFTKLFFDALLDEDVLTIQDRVIFALCMGTSSVLSALICVLSINNLR